MSIKSQIYHEIKAALTTFGITDRKILAAVLWATRDALNNHSNLSDETKLYLISVSLRRETLNNPEIEKSIKTILEKFKDDFAREQRFKQFALERKLELKAFNERMDREDREKRNNRIKNFLIFAILYGLYLFFNS